MPIFHKQSALSAGEKNLWRRWKSVSLSLFVVFSRWHCDLICFMPPSAQVFALEKESLRRKALSSERDFCFDRGAVCQGQRAHEPWKPTLLSQCSAEIPPKARILCAMRAVVFRHPCLRSRMVKSSCWDRLHLESQAAQSVRLDTDYTASGRLQRYCSFKGPEEP